MDLLLQLSCALFSIAFFGVLITIVHARRRWLVLGKLPHPPSCDTFWGAMEVIKDLNHIAHHLCATGERLNTGIFAIRILHQDMVFVIDPAIVQQALPLPKAQQIYQVFNAVRFCCSDKSFATAQNSYFDSNSSIDNKHGWGTSQHSVSFNKRRVLENGTQRRRTRVQSS